MAITDEDLRLIVKHLDALLTPEEQLRFDQLMETSEEFRRELRQSKLLIAAAEIAHNLTEAKPFGINASGEIDGKAVMQRVRDERDRFAGFVVESTEALPAEDRLRGYA